MSKRTLTILEVSQKQAYIFSSNKLKENVTNSAIIAWVMSKEYFAEKSTEAALFRKEENYVYSGGGHAVLEFADYGQAAQFTRRITTVISTEYPGTEVFAASVEYCDSESPGENLKKLSQKLERKKSIRASAFHQGTFGIERLDAATKRPVLSGKKENQMPQAEKKAEGDLTPMGYQQPYRLEDLGGSEGDSNFIAIVHIDGNAMGSRVGKVYEKYKDADWAEFKEKIREFSDAIDRDFKAAYLSMANVVARNLESGQLASLSIKSGFLPLRRIITAGDDICYVAEGRIGIESAAVLLKELSRKKNPVDGEVYSACAGVAIVHQKYPFYKAYELAELLCSNAKRFGANLSEDGTGQGISSIDWHIDFGELKDSLEEIRKAYSIEGGASGEKSTLELRPYMVEAPDEILAKEPIRQYRNFRRLEMKLLSGEISYARRKLKGLRPVLKQGETAVTHYLEFHKISEIARDAYQGIFKEVDYHAAGTGKGLEGKIYATTQDGIKRSLLFDAIEVMDTYIALEGLLRNSKPAEVRTAPGTNYGRGAAGNCSGEWGLEGLLRNSK